MAAESPKLVHETGRPGRQGRPVPGPGGEGRARGGDRGRRPAPPGSCTAGPIRSSAHAILLLILGLWYFGGKPSQVRTFDTRAARLGVRRRGGDDRPWAGSTPRRRCPSSPRRPRRPSRPSPGSSRPTSPPTPWPASRGTAGTPAPGRATASAWPSSATAARRSGASRSRWATPSSPSSGTPSRRHRPPRHRARRQGDLLERPQGQPGRRARRRQHRRLRPREHLLAQAEPRRLEGPRPRPARRVPLVRPLLRRQPRGPRRRPAGRSGSSTKAGSRSSRAGSTVPGLAEQDLHPDRRRGRAAAARREDARLQGLSIRQVQRSTNAPRWEFVNLNPRSIRPPAWPSRPSGPRRWRSSGGRPSLPSRWRRSPCSRVRPGS